MRKAESWTRVAAVAAVMAVGFVRPAAAQYSQGRTLLTVFGGWFIASDVSPLYQSSAFTVDVGDAFEYGGRLGYFWKNGFAVEGSYARASSTVNIRNFPGTNPGSGTANFNIWNLDFLFTTERYRKPVIGYFALGAGAAYMTSNLTTQTSTRFTYDFGLGAIFLPPKNRVGFRVDARYRGIDLATTTGGGTVCDFWGCYSYASSNYSTGEITGAIVFAFR
ncbi:MAG TPA: outer membrane beta-barrel protein [Gemmatimonadaceae bacterium]|nr:outer membrane beta-barrel protein [Gemmatimonadaceae bacterium]